MSVLVRPAASIGQQLVVAARVGVRTLRAVVASAYLLAVVAYWTSITLTAWWVAGFEAQFCAARACIGVAAGDGEMVGAAMAAAQAAGLSEPVATLGYLPAILIHGILLVLLAPVGIVSGWPWFEDTGDDDRPTGILVVALGVLAVTAVLSLVVNLGTMSWFSHILD